MMFWKKWRFQRKFKFIDRKQQTRFAVEVCLHAVVFPMLFYIFVILPPFSSIFVGKRAEFLQPRHIEHLMLVLDVWWIPLFCLFIVGYFSVLFSHRIFGPIRRLTNALEAYNRGEADVSCNLRQGDYFFEFAELLDKALFEEQTTDPTTATDQQKESQEA